MKALTCTATPRPGATTRVAARSAGRARAGSASPSTRIRRRRRAPRRGRRSTASVPTRRRRRTWRRRGCCRRCGPSEASSSSSRAPWITLGERARAARRAGRRSRRAAPDRRPSRAWSDRRGEVQAVGGDLGEGRLGGGVDQQGGRLPVPSNHEPHTKDLRRTMGHSDGRGARLTSALRDCLLRRRRIRGGMSDVLKSLPSVLTQVGELKIHRSSQSKWPENGVTTASEENIITLYDNASKYGLKKVITHELSHILWKNLDRNNREKYFSDADWALNSKGEVINQRAVVSEDDGRLSPEEDFANNVEHFITSKNYKQKLTPAIENCLRNILGMKNDK